MYMSFLSLAIILFLTIVILYSNKHKVFHIKEFSKYFVSKKFFLHQTFLMKI